MFRSMTRVVSKSSNVGQGNGYRVGTPKTRYGVNDRSISSPRLKSFPAETIRRMDRSPRKNVPKNMGARQQVMNSGQGDGAPDYSHPQLTFSAPNENISCTSEQQFSRDVYPINGHVNQSELAIPSSKMAPMERPHRPFVPNICHPTRDNSPRKFVVQNESPQGQQGAERSDPWKAENDSIKHGHEQVMDFPPNQPIVAREISEVPQRPFRRDPNVSSISHMTDGSFPEFSRQQIDPRPSVYHHSVNDNEHQTRRQYVETNSGMSSPQDIAINQIKYQKSHVQPNNYIRPNQPWIPDNQLRPSEPVVNKNWHIHHHDPKAVQTMANQNPADNWHHQGQQQYYNRPNDEPRHDYQSSNAPQPHQRQNLSGNWENVKQQQYYNNRNEIINEKSRQQFEKVEEKRKPLKFTPAMIRDQEMLVGLMRQQGINEDVMRRQFDALLAEQKKQLLYQEQLENPGKDVNQLQRVQRRRISRTDEDGKPEWMMHITPPRIPYSVVEKIQSERRLEPQRTIIKNSNVVEIVSENQESPKKREIYAKETEQYRQHPWQMANAWQPQNSYILTNNINVPREKMAMDEYQQRYYGYPVQHQQNPVHYQQNPVQYQQNPVQHQQNPTDNWQNDKPKNVEPSSLLKLRIYKEVIKRQKQSNGLQDPETIKEAMEALKNPANRRGLEYLENLNKKREKPVALNGTQDPSNMINNDQQMYVYQPFRKPVSANGLENSRNPNNPRMSSRPRTTKELYVSEYPRQRVLEPRSYNPEKLDETMNQQNYNQMRSDNANYHYQNHPEFNQHNNHPMSYSTQNQIRYDPQQMQQRYENHVTSHQGFYHDPRPENTRQQGYEYPYQNAVVNEPVVIGGLKYFARKPEYSHIPAQHYPTHGKIFNPMIPCQ